MTLSLYDLVISEHLPQLKSYLHLIDFLISGHDLANPTTLDRVYPQLFYYKQNGYQVRSHEFSAENPS